MGTVSVLTGIVGFIALIVFFVMAAALANISKNIKNINRYITGWGIENGFGMIYKCQICKPKCPHCGDVKSYA